MDWELDLSELDGLPDLVLVVAVEWWEGANHFVEEASEGVVVHCFVMRVSEQHFGAEVLG